MPCTKTQHVAPPDFRITEVCGSCAQFCPKVRYGIRFVIREQNERIRGSNTWGLCSVSRLPHPVSFPEQTCFPSTPNLPHRDTSHRPITATPIRFCYFSHPFGVITIRSHSSKRPGPFSTKYRSSVSSTRRTANVLWSWFKLRTWRCVVFFFFICWTMLGDSICTICSCRLSAAYTEH